MCEHHGDPDEPCPFCECGCGTVTDFYTRTNVRDGAVKGHHKLFATGHRQGGIHDAETDSDLLVKNLLRKALASGATGDDLVKAFIDSNELAAAIVLAQVQKAINGNVQSANWLFARGIGTATRKGNNAPKANFKDIFTDPLESGDELYDE